MTFELPRVVSLADNVSATLTSASTLTEAKPFGRQLIPLNASGGVFTVTLPDATTCPGVELRLYKALGDTSLNTVTVVSTGAQTIAGASTVALLGAGHYFELFSDGSNWLIGAQTLKLFSRSILYPNYGFSAGGITYTAGTSQPSSPALGDLFYNTTNFSIHQCVTAGTFTGALGTWAGGSGGDYYPYALDLGAAGSASGLLTAKFACPASGAVDFSIEVAGYATSVPGWITMYDVGNSQYVTGTQESTIPPGLTNMGKHTNSGRVSSLGSRSSPIALVPGQVYTWQACWKAGNHVGSVQIDNSIVSFRIEAADVGT